MRVIAGRLGGRLFDSPHTHKTHPMSDKARGALFNILGDIDGMHVLDPFAGTGALSLEAVSRGAASALAIESDQPAQKVIDQNIRSLGLASQIKLVKASANAWLTTNHDETFDLVLCDPPHDDLQPNLLTRLAQRVEPGGIIVFSFPPHANFSLPTVNYEPLTAKSYGDMQLKFYRRK
jgi:16S rRNA (guanine966-N2)-methyltransferase